MNTNFSEIINIILSFILGIVIALAFWFSFRPRHIIIKNNDKKLTK